jgi:heme-degrading monooxygenase HmoA
MYARLTTTRLAPNERDASAEVLEQVMPVFRQLDGFKGMIVVSEGDGRRIVAMSLWESAEALDAGSGVMDQIRDAETALRDVESQETSVFRVVGFDVRWLSTQALGK